MVVCDEPYNGLLVLKNERFNMFVTIDVGNRSACMGIAPSISNTLIVDSAVYVGRGWRDRLIADAKRAAEERCIAAHI